MDSGRGSATKHHRKDRPGHPLRHLGRLHQNHRLLQNHQSRRQQSGASKHFSRSGREKLPHDKRVQGRAFAGSAARKAATVLPSIRTKTTRRPATVHSSIRTKTTRAAKEVSRTVSDRDAQRRVAQVTVGAPGKRSLSGIRFSDLAVIARRPTKPGLPVGIPSPIPRPRGALGALTLPDEQTTLVWATQWLLVSDVCLAHPPWATLVKP